MEAVKIAMVIIGNFKEGKNGIKKAEAKRFRVLQRQWQNNGVENAMVSIREVEEAQ